MKLRSVSGNHVMLPLPLIRVGVNLLETLFPLESCLKDFSNVTVSCDFAPGAISSRNLRSRPTGVNRGEPMVAGAFHSLQNVSHDTSRARVEAELNAAKSAILEESPGIERYGRVETKIVGTSLSTVRDFNNWFPRRYQKSLVECSPETRYLLMFSDGPRKEVVQRTVNDSSIVAVHFDFAVRVAGVEPLYLAPQLQHCLISVADLDRPVD
jgi:hypothetical protein